MNANLYLIGAGLLVSAYFAGRYSAPEKIEIRKEIVTVEVEKKTEDKNFAVDKLVCEEVKPDGTRKTLTRFKALKNVLTQSSIENETYAREMTKVENRRGVIVSVLAGVPLKDFSYFPLWGASVSKQLLGPIVIGVWGFSDLRVGVSLGMEF